MTLSRPFGRRRRAAQAAYLAIVEQARQPHFYAGRGVPDSLDGRFEMIALHAFLVLHRLRGEPGHKKFGQALFDVMFDDMDRGLREMGTGDLSVGKQVKRMAKAFYGCSAAYQAGLAGEADLAHALRRNLYGTVAEPGERDIVWMADYLRAQAVALARVPAAEIAAGAIGFAPPPLDSPGPDAEF